MTPNPRDVINPANLPVSAQTCKPIYPNQYLKVNTIFNVARQAGLRTAWSDKHPAYLIALRAVRERRAGLLHARDQQPGPRVPGR